MEGLSKSMFDGLDTFSEQLRDTNIPTDDLVEKLILLLKSRHISKPEDVAESVALLLRSVVESNQDGTSSDLLKQVSSVGQRLVSAEPRKLIIGNAVGRILGLIRDEADRNQGVPSPAGDSLKAEVIEGIEEFLDELHQNDEQVASYATEHIHSHDVVLTNSSSPCVVKFLLKAATKRTFSLILAESYPNVHALNWAAAIGKDRKQSKTHRPASKALTSAGIHVHLVPDSAIFGLMPRANKVIVEADAVLADGSCLSTAGTNTIAHAAKSQRAAVIVLSGVYKISSQFPFDTKQLLENGDTNSIFPRQIPKAGSKPPQMQNTLNDFMSASLIDVHISNLGGHAPSSISGIIRGHYRIEDYALSQ